MVDHTGNNRLGLRWIRVTGSCLPHLDSTRPMTKMWHVLQSIDVSLVFVIPFAFLIVILQLRNRRSDRIRAWCIMTGASPHFSPFAFEGLLISLIEAICNQSLPFMCMDSRRENQLNFPWHGHGTLFLLHIDLFLVNWYYTLPIQ